MDILDQWALMKSAIFVCLTFIVYVASGTPISVYEAIGVTTIFWMMLKAMTRLPEPFEDIEVEDEEEA